MVRQEYDPVGRIVDGQACVIVEIEATRQHRPEVMAKHVECNVGIACGSFSVGLNGTGLPPCMIARGNGSDCEPEHRSEVRFPSLRTDEADSSINHVPL